MVSGRSQTSEMVVVVHTGATKVVNKLGAPTDPSSNFPTRAPGTRRNGLVLRVGEQDVFVVTGVGGVTTTMVISITSGRQV